MYVYNAFLIVSSMMSLFLKKWSVMGSLETINNSSCVLLQQKTKLRVLKKSLRRIARDDNILIIATLDAASRSLFDLFIESFRVGERTDVLIRHLLVLATDQKALEHCRSSHMHCHLLGAEGNSRSAADDGHVMMRQLEFQQTLVELGYSFIYTVGGKIDLHGEGGLVVLM